MHLAPGWILLRPVTVVLLDDRPPRWRLRRLVRPQHASHTNAPLSHACSFIRTADSAPPASAWIVCLSHPQFITAECNPNIHDCSAPADYVLGGQEYYIIPGENDDKQVCGDGGEPPLDLGDDGPGSDNTLGGFADHTGDVSGSDNTFSGQADNIEPEGDVLGFPSDNTADYGTFDNGFNMAPP